MAATLDTLRASTARLRSLEAETAAERERRKLMVVELVDGGADRRDICAAADCTPKTICVYLADAGQLAIAV